LPVSDDPIFVAEIPLVRHDWPFVIVDERFGIESALLA
jgi:hypothetical protein